MAEEQAQITLYGTTWCSGTWVARRLLDEHQVVYRWVDIDQDTEADAYVKQVNNGYRSVPTIVFPDGSIMVEPSGMALARKLKSLK
jgi:mycoredoxin